MITQGYSNDCNKCSSSLNRFQYSHWTANDKVLFANFILYSFVWKHFTYHKIALFWYIEPNYHSFAGKEHNLWPFKPVKVNCKNYLFSPMAILAFIESFTLKIKVNIITMWWWQSVSTTRTFLIHLHLSPYAPHRVI